MSRPGIWVVRVPQEHIDKVKQLGVVGIGYGVAESIRDITDREELKNRYLKYHPGVSDVKAGLAVGQLYRIARLIQPNDWILTPDRATRKVCYGQVVGEYEFSDILSPNLPHVRRVKWLGEFSRDQMSSRLKNSMGGLQTVLKMDAHYEEIMRLMTGQQAPAAEPDDEALMDFYADVKARADELIGDLIDRLDPYDLQELVAGLLEALGYRTKVSPPGPDHGVDVVAHPDALGFESPCIKVQVKHRQSAATGPDIRNLIGTLREDEKGLFVSTGGFTRDAYTEAARSGRIVLIDTDQLVSLLTEYYEKIDPDYKSLLPLRKVWVPARE